MPDAGRLSPRLRAEELEQTVAQLRRRHAGLLLEVDSVTAKLYSLTDKKAALSAELEGVRAAHMQLMATKTDANVVEARELETEVSQITAKLETLRAANFELVRERKGMVHHLVDGFEERAHATDVARRRLLQRAARDGAAGPEHSGDVNAASPSTVLDADLEATSVLKKNVASLFRNAATEVAMLEDYVAVLQQRLLDARIRRDHEVYEYDCALGRAQAA